MTTEVLAIWTFKNGWGNVSVLAIHVIWRLRLIAIQYAPVEIKILRYIRWFVGFTLENDPNNRLMKWVNK